MCGICGYYGIEENKTLLKKMNSAQSHRGPDGEGYYSDKKVGFGHRRLAIIDRECGIQPMYSKDKRYVIIYNGEIYNYRELKIELEKKNYHFMSDSDTEVILIGYQEWGVKV